MYVYNNKITNMEYGMNIKMFALQKQFYDYI